MEIACIKVIQNSHSLLLTPRFVKIQGERGGREKGADCCWGKDGWDEREGDFPGPASVPLNFLIICEEASRERVVERGREQRGTSVAKIDLSRLGSSAFHRGDRHLNRFCPALLGRRLKRCPCCMHCGDLGSYYASLPCNPP